MTRQIDKPRSGFFKMRLSRGGVFMPAQIYSFQMKHRIGLGAEIAGRAADVMRVWISGREIDKAEYVYLMQRVTRARTYIPASPYSNPQMTLDFGTIPLSEL